MEENVREKFCGGSLDVARNHHLHSERGGSAREPKPTPDGGASLPGKEENRNRAKNASFR